MAARDFEDLLQVCSYTFRPFIPSHNVAIISVASRYLMALPEPHNGAIQHLLFLCAHWHGLAKLRMHSDLTLDIMDEVTASLGKAFRHFDTKVCSAYGTKELPKETEARRRRRHAADPTGNAKTTDGGPLKKTFNLQTYKYHSLGDYSRTIRRLGTTDSYSTSTVRIVRVAFQAVSLWENLQGELEHRRPKGWHRRTDRRNFIKQMTRIERRQARIRRIKHKTTSTSKAACEKDIATTPDVHYHIGKSENRHEHIPSFLRAHEGDPAVLVRFIYLQFFSKITLAICLEFPT